MQKYYINEVFYSLQGEGARVGTPTIFVRFSGCNIKCKFCDTDHSFRESLTKDELLKMIEQYPCKNILWTGGEPALQVDAELVNLFKKKGYYQAIETNGTMSLPKGIDYISISPKCSFVAIKKLFPDGVNEIRLPIDSKQKTLPLPSMFPMAEHYFLSPIFDGDTMNTDNLNHCVKLIKENPEWKLSLQAHKLWKIQ